jgi:hypothetical protein
MLAEERKDFCYYRTRLAHETQLPWCLKLYRLRHLHPLNNLLAAIVNARNLVQYALYIRRYFPDRPTPVYTSQEMSPSIERKQRLGPVVVRVNPLAYSFRTVINTLTEGKAVNIAAAGNSRCILDRVICMPFRTYASALGPLYDLVRVAVKHNGHIDLLTDFCECCVKRFSLRYGPGKAVQDHSFPGVEVCQFFSDHRNDEAIRYILALVIINFRLQAERCFLLHVLSKELTGGDVPQAEIFGKGKRLRAFARTRRPKQN